MRWQLAHRPLNLHRAYTTCSKPIVSIKDATFYRQYPSSPAENGSAHIFPNLSFDLASDTKNQQHWAIVGPSNAGKTTLCEILRGQHIVLPPGARTFPHLVGNDVPQLRNPLRAVQYVGFSGERSDAQVKARGAYLSARYESRREETDFTVKDYILGETQLNPSESQLASHPQDSALEEIAEQLKLEALLSMPIGNLSNGQSRRARIAKALLSKPLVLLLDEPFLGLDPPTVIHLSTLLHTLAAASAPKLVLALRPQDPLPDWVTHVIRLGEPLRIASLGPKDRVKTRDSMPPAPKAEESKSGKLISSDTYMQGPDGGEVVMSMQGINVSYGDKIVLGGAQRRSGGQLKQGDPEHEGLWWEVRRGQRWGVFGPNGSGKTTLISLICSDHPQAYSQPVEIFGQSRLPKPGRPGISIFDIQSRIGQSSPEIHAFFPKRLSLRKTLENAWADTFLGTPRLPPGAKERVETCLRWFEHELRPLTSLVQSKERDSNWIDDITFGQSPFSAQRIVLFLRAIIKKPDLVVLDEAFSGMDDDVRDKCMKFLDVGDEASIDGLDERQALLCVSHVKEEVPRTVRQWMRLPESGSREPPTFGTLTRPLDGDDQLWARIWGMEKLVSDRSVCGFP